MFLTNQFPLRRTWLWLVGGLFLLFLVIVFSKIHAGGNGGDFRGFYAAGERLRSGSHLYHSEDVTPFKYSPLAAVFLAPFSLFSFATGEWLYLLFMISVLSALPLLVLRSQFPKIKSTLSLVAALGVGLLCSLRFIDNEIHSVQANFFALGFIVTGYLIWTSSSQRYSKSTRAWSGAICFVCGALFKFHPLFALGVFLRWRGYRTLLLLTTAIIILAMFPSPVYWSGYTEHMTTTSQQLSILHSTILQGFYPFGGFYLGLDRSAHLPLVLFAPIAVSLLFFVKKFDLFDEAISPSSNPASFLLSSVALLLLALTVSPIPWQHTYVLLWVFVPLSYLVCTSGERKVLLLLSLLMGLSARGLAGRALSDWLELHQSVFLLALGFVAFFAWQGRRLGRMEVG